ncbi:uncharacterized protein LOC130510645 isoform X1 [Raphanus sativus]|uniref:Uncharacterized protein LOC108860145 isoform X1 n=1 Tax=Raphanus sativus TaxID=3726 RepID=A0A9W3D056_RAPSA|nr:uncharacterized protein LOC108860145 isoform X1 [Raphanus sativus]XP_056863135.1 uncharacterized protein LOC130510645 isoform X1 [Raphanus sativus]
MFHHSSLARLLKKGIEQLFVLWQERLAVYVSSNVPAVIIGDPSRFRQIITNLELRKLLMRWLLSSYEARGRQFTAVSRTSGVSGTGTWWGQCGNVSETFQSRWGRQIFVETA